MPIKTQDLMRTVDIHTHLLSPEVSFDRLFDRFSVRFFAKKLGVDRKSLQTAPYRTYVEAMARSIRSSEHVEKACLFAVDARYDRNGRQTARDKTVCAMTQDVLDVTARFPDCFIPFLSINPLRADALEQIDRHVEKGCQGAKFLQNYWGLDMNDEGLIPYYEKLQAHGLPLVVHIGSEYTIDSMREYEGVDMLKLPLTCGIKVIAAHMGLGRFQPKLRLWNNFSRNPNTFDEDYSILLDKLKSEENLYADISAILVPMRARALRHLSEQREVHDKILFGTDYPVPFTTTFNSYDLAWSVRRNISRIANPFDRYAAAILEYFPADSPIYNNYKKVIKTTE
ncbi:MAG: amidohydrolase family protein, partial [Gammaproteobacteria bacterium]|nr:amidohydrolase family protein [Gammaproteobacteria bacterium]